MLRPDIVRHHSQCELAIDLCCGGGGMSMGLWQAGFEVIGIDINPQPNYPFQFIQADATQIDPSWLAEVADVVSLSPPCQVYSVTSNLFTDEVVSKHPRLIAPLRTLVQQSGLPYILENVEGAKKELISPVKLCGSGKGLRVRRHRLIESNVPIIGIPCDHEWQDYAPCYKVYVGKDRESRGYKHTGVMPVFGGSPLVGGGQLFHASVAMGIHWMNQEELNEAIPPAYGMHLGKQLLAYIGNLRHIA